MKPGTLVYVFGKSKGIVIRPGKAKGPDGMVRVEYRDFDTGMKISAYVPEAEVKERKA